MPSTVVKSPNLANHDKTSKQLHSVPSHDYELNVQDAMEMLQVQVEVNADPERARGPTIASAAQEAERAAAFLPVHGYTTETLLKDKRFKVPSHPCLC